MHSTRAANAAIAILGAGIAGLQVLRVIVRFIDWHANQRPLPDPMETRTP